jgi:hypothetical protein
MLWGGCRMHTNDEWPAPPHLHLNHASKGRHEAQATPGHVLVGFMPLEGSNGAG